ncbi:MAG: hypothetical protein QM673_01940 [Gordonia sp. (in: high G+C Gram-positive bacteria)]
MSFEVAAIVVVAWAMISVVAALVVGAMIRLRDHKEVPRELHVVGRDWTPHPEDDDLSGL